MANKSLIAWAPTRKQAPANGRYLRCTDYALKSIAGLISARVCADHFQNIIIIDPTDHQIAKTGQDMTKKRVAQYDSLHVYLTFMVDGLRRLWPNLEASIEQAGGLFRPGDFRLHFAGIPILAAHAAYPKTTSKAGDDSTKTTGLPSAMFIRRPKFEAVLYQLLIESSSDCIQMIQGSVTGLVPSGDMCNIQSVDVRTADGGEKTVEDVALVIDCTGSTQAGLKWLKTSGFISPRTDGDLRLTYNPKLSYVTVSFQDFGDLAQDLPIPGGFDQAGFICTYNAYPKWGNSGFVFARMDDTKDLWTSTKALGGLTMDTLQRFQSKAKAVPEKAR
ncbi:hypothetical protein EYR40_009859 [Pleurotus pulmonarius]|nr:hypothetical protein EYR38_002905 [Pleurotus pulmonarius]KAF4591256.1 hypothetical protein EYR40_009859 [Pleurotus pulmonarius]